MLKKKGVTLIELMIALALVTIGIIGMVNSFGFIQKGIQASKNKTLASNLAQEKMQIIKQKVYYQVLVTSDPAHNTTDFAPESIDYDTGYFPPENITEAGVTYARYTLVQPARENSGVMEVLSPSTPDTGLRLITITVVWSQGGVKRKLALRSLMANPDTVMANAVFTGYVKDSAWPNLPIEGALVNVAENMGWRDTADAAGRYYINASPGNYYMVASADGYYTQIKLVSVAANASLSQDFSMVRIATASVSGTVWLRDHPVISQVVASTTMVNGDNVEYVELFNPTTYPINVGDAGGSQLKLKYLGELGASQDLPEFSLTYISTYIAPGRFYLIANTSTLTVGGYTPVVDAVYKVANVPPCTVVGTLLSCIHSGKAGAIILSDPSGNVLDKVGWTNTSEGRAAPDYEGTPYSLSDGLDSARQLVRMSEPCSLSSPYGRGYDSGNNSVNFYYTPMSYSPYSSASGAKTVMSGTPAAGAIITASDGVSTSTVAWNALVSGSCPASTFTLVNVATGTWTVIISSGQYMLQNDTVTVLSPGDVYNFPSSTTFLTQTATMGVITGRVLNAFGAPITSPSPITLSAGGAGSPTTASASDGRYRLLVSTGMVDVIANPGNANASYVSLSSVSIPAQAGVVWSGVDFILYQGGRVSGFVTRDGINALPGIAVSITDINGISRDQQVSGTDGRFTSISVPTGTYTAQPAIGSLEQSIPSSTTVSLTSPGATKFSSTFTITGAMGYIAGTVQSGGQPIKTGVLIVVTTTTLPGTSPPVPPALSAATLAGVPYYVASSMEDGTYNIAVRQATSPSYNVYAYYPTPSGTGVTMVYQKVSGVQVLSGQTTTGVNFSW